MMKFEKFEQYSEQQRVAMQAQQERERQYFEAGAKVAELKAERERERVMREAILSDTNADKQIDELTDQIAEAERVLQRKDLEYKMSATLRTDITKEDIISSWNSEFTPQYEKEVFNPAIESLLRAKLAYINAYKEYKRVVREHETLKEDIIRTISPNRYLYTMSTVDFNYTTETDKYYIKEQDVLDLAGSGDVRSIIHLKKEDA